MVQNLLKAADLSALHDSELYLVRRDRDYRSLKLGFRNIDRTFSNMLFGNILTYRMDNIQCQDVVSRIIASNTTSGFEDNIEKIARWTSSVANNLLISEDKLRTHIGKIRSGDLQLIYVQPSWGAEIGVIAETVTLSHDPTC